MIIDFAGDAGAARVVAGVHPDENQESGPDFG